MGHQSLGCVMFLAALLAAHAVAETTTVGVFSGDVLPLTVGAITPAGGTPEDAAALRGQEALQVVFSRAVIALGSDWGASPALASAPFTLVAKDARVISVPGQFRWATTYIGRFDPDGAWPTDLDFELRIDETLKTFEGIPLSLEAEEDAGSSSRPPWADGKVAFSTPGLTMSVVSVASAQAAALTGGAWAPKLSSSEKAFECPADAEIRVQVRVEREGR